MKNPLPSWLTVGLSAAVPAITLALHALPAGPVGYILAGLWTGLAAALHLAVDPSK